MSQNLPENTKSFWQRKEGTTGMIIAGLAGLVFVINAPAILAWAQVTLHAVILIGVIGGIAYLCLDSKFRTLFSYGYQVAMRKLTGLFIEMNPIAIIEIYIEKLKQNLVDMATQVKNLRSQMGSLKKVIETNEEERQKAVMSAKASKKNSKDELFIMQTRQAGRLENSNVKLKQLYNKLEVMYRVLRKMYENAGYVLQDTSAQVEVSKREYNAINASSSAFRSAMSIINGNPNDRILFERSMQHMADTVGEKVGEMEHFMDISKNFMDSIDVQNGVFEEEGMKMLEKWEKQSSNILLSAEEKEKIFADSADESNLVDATDESEERVRVGVGRSGNNYADLLK